MRKILKLKLKEILGLLGFLIVLGGFIYTFMNPNITEMSFKVVSDGIRYFVVSPETQVEGYFEIGTVTQTYIDYWNRYGFLTMAIGLATILFGFLFGDHEIKIRRKKCRYTPTELGNLRDKRGS